MSYMTASTTKPVCDRGCYAASLTSAKVCKSLLSRDLCFGILPQDRVSQGLLQSTVKCCSVWQAQVLVLPERQLCLRVLQLLQQPNELQSHLYGCLGDLGPTFTQRSNAGMAEWDLSCWDTPKLERPSAPSCEWSAAGELLVYWKMSAKNGGALSDRRGGFMSESSQLSC